MSIWIKAIKDNDHYFRVGDVFEITENNVNRYGSYYLPNNGGTWNSNMFEVIPEYEFNTEEDIKIVAQFSFDPNYVDANIIVDSINSFFKTAKDEDYDFQLDTIEGEIIGSLWTKEKE